MIAERVLAAAGHGRPSALQEGGSESKKIMDRALAAFGCGMVSRVAVELW